MTAGGSETTTLVRTTPPPVRASHVFGPGATPSNAVSGTDPTRHLHSPPAIVETLLQRSVVPPKTPSGSPAFDAFNEDDERSQLSASQRVRVGLSALLAHGAGSVGNDGEREVGTRRKSHDSGASAKKSDRATGPMSCPPTFAPGSAPHFSALTESPRQLHRAGHSNTSLSSKLLPSRASINSMLGYVRELYQSEASLRVELEQMRQRVERQQAEAQATVRALQDAMRHAELAHENARARVAEQDALICALQDHVSQLQLQQRQVADAIHGAHQAVASPVCAIETRTVPVAPIASSSHELALSQRPVKPLWEPWSSGSDSPLLTAAPPMFTVAPSASDLLPPSCPLGSAFVSGSGSENDHSHELTSIVPPFVAASREAVASMDTLSALSLSSLPEEAVEAAASSSTERLTDSVERTRASKGASEVRRRDEQVDEPSEQPGATIEADGRQGFQASVDQSAAPVEASAPSPSKLFQPPSHEHKVSLAAPLPVIWSIEHSRLLVSCVCLCVVFAIPARIDAHG